MTFYTRKMIAAVLAPAVLAIGGPAAADSIDPTSYMDTLAVGESVTIRKTVTVDDAPAVDSPLDVFFSIDTSGSMGTAIAGAKAASTSILSGLGGVGDLAVGVGVYAESATGDPPPGAFINLDLSTDTGAGGAVDTAIGAVTVGDPDFGGDFPERGQDAIKAIAEGASWRTGSKRFIVSLGDASWKNDLVSDADAIAALAAEDITLIGLRFSDLSSDAAFEPGTDDDTFTESVLDLGGTALPTGTDPADITAAIIAAITSSFDTYSTVAVDDLGNGLPEIEVSSVCVSAAGGACVGAVATGMYDRSTTNVFEFDVTFTRVASGDTTFDTYGLVDGVIAATEVDTFKDGSVIPLPATAWMLLAGIGGLGALRRRKKS